MAVEPNVHAFVHDGNHFVDVHEFVAVIVADLMKAPSDMVATRDDIIAALRKYASQAVKAMEAS